MSNAFDRNAVSNFRSISIERFVFEVLIWLSSQNSHIKLLRQIFAEFGQQLSGRFRVGPIGSIGEENFLPRGIQNVPIIKRMDRD